ncbi:MAG: LptF/LptG family permease [Spirochaetes bacterium]|nr:LptF/LptG family permease [Spirochaetota bacterium]
MKDSFYSLNKIIIDYFKKLPYSILKSVINLIKGTFHFIKNFSFKKTLADIINFIKRPIILTKLYKMLLRSFFYWFLIAQGLFVIIFLIFDFFSKVYSYIDNQVSSFDILAITFLLAPRAIWFTMPIAIMFGIIMALSSLYQNNELIAIFTSGISIYRLVIPIIIFNIFLSIFMIFADSFIVIPTFRHRENLYEYFTRPNKDEYDITIKGKNNYFWKVYRFVSSNNTLINLTLFRINDSFNITFLLEAQNAVYTKNGWIFKSGTLREWNDDGTLKHETKFYKRTIEDLEEDPRTFRNVFKKSDYEIDRMTIPEAQARIKLLKELGIAFDEELLNYYKKFSFPFTLLIVCLIAIGVSTLSQRNILILALFFSIGLAIIYYVMQMLISALASGGRINPFIGAWLSVFIFLPIGVYLVRKAKT